MNGVPREAFSMEKLKLLKDGGIHYEATITVNQDGATYEIKRKDDVPIIPAPDLENPIRNLKEKLLMSCHLLDGRAVLNSSEFKATKAQKDAIEKQTAILMEKASVTGIHKSGQEQNAGVIITGKIKAENGSNVAINSPRMRFTSAVYGFEEDLERAVELIADELYLYLFEGKKGQLDVFDSDQQDGKA